MPKTQTKWSEKTYLKRLREGRGRGELESYKPLVTVQEIPSKGISAMILGEKTHRLHHFFSRNEIAFFYLLEANEDVLDIREQYPLLDVLDTVRISEKAGINHPRDLKSRYPYVFTSDFFIVTRSGIKVRSIKTREDLLNRRTLEKQEIERQYWLEYGYEWKIVTDKMIDLRKAENLAWLRTRVQCLQEMIPDRDILMEAVCCFAECFRESAYPIIVLAGDVEEIFGFEPGAGLCIFAKAVRDRLIEIDLCRPLDMTAVRNRRGWAI